MSDNLILKTDSYKLTHWAQYPPRTTMVYSYFESRHGATWPYTVFFGLQYLIKRYLEGEVITAEKIDEAERVVAAHMGSAEMFNRAGWEFILNEYGGRLPIRIAAVPEGTVVGESNVLMTVENTDPSCYWLTNYLETLLTHVWYPSTVATLSLATKLMMRDYLRATASTFDALPFMLHDFGYRGVSSDESAGIGGLAHLINFSGTDTVEALVTAMDYYYGDLTNLAFSVAATEHSIMTAEGQEGEVRVLDRLLETYPTGILSVVADSYNIYDFAAEVVKRKDQILARDGRFVLRPDSITDADPTPHELVVTLLNELYDHFPGGHNGLGYRVLDPHIRLLWGDGIGHDGIEEILRWMTNENYSAENIVFGMGGGLLQKVNRDTQRFAFKASAMVQAAQIVRVRKNPLDPSKASKAGFLALYPQVPDGGQFTTSYTTREIDGNERDTAGILRTVFMNGELMRPTTFDEVRDRTAAAIR